jgi:hypothetical protein
MSAAALLAELEAIGIQITREGYTLRVRGNPGVNPAPYRERIREAKPVIIAMLRQREAIAELTNQLEVGWRWMEDHPNHPEHERFFARWLVKLDEYERADAASRQGGTT